MGHALNRGTFFDARGFAAHVEKYRKRFFRRPMNWAMEKSLLAAYTPPLRNKVRKPAGFPTPFGWAYPVLVGAVDLSGRRASAIWGRALPFPLPLTQSGSLRASRHPFGGGFTRSYSVQGLCAAAYRAQTGEGLCPSPCPLPGGNPSVRLDAGQLPLHRGAEGTIPQVRCANPAGTGEPKAIFRRCTKGEPLNLSGTQLEGGGRGGRRGER